MPARGRAWAHALRWSPRGNRITFRQERRMHLTRAAMTRTYFGLAVGLAMYLLFVMNAE
jgi:hypothetical protein